MLGGRGWGWVVMRELRGGAGLAILGWSWKASWKEFKDET